jgi:hypothetical protein
LTFVVVPPSIKSHFAGLNDPGCDGMWRHHISRYCISEFQAVQALPAHSACAHCSNDDGECCFQLRFVQCTTNSFVLYKLLVFLGGISLKVKVEVPRNSAFGRGISDRVVGACLVFALVSVLFLAVAMMVSDMHDAARSPIMRRAQTHSGGAREPIRFPAHADDHFHLFLSHVWSTGQDQVLAIKKELTLLVPSLSIFLDVEK